MLGARMTNSFLSKEETQLLLLGGLPGSGKTTCAKRLEKQGWIFYDDSQNRATDDSSDFHASRHYTELVSHLQSARRCVVSDIRVIHAEYRRSAELALRKDVGAVSLRE